MGNDNLKASVQYDDYSGTVAADKHDREDIFDLAEKYGIDTKRYFVMGIEFHIGEIRDDKKCIHHLFRSWQLIRTRSKHMA